jgi:dephospho-CoA kinase
MNADGRDADALGDGRPLLIGITGPIGCGKSTVARMLAQLGGTVIDADVLARRATEPGRPAVKQIRQRFGDGVFDDSGNLDRAAMAGVVFEDAAALRALEQIVHPEVRVLVEEELRKAAADDVPFAVIEAIKLVEGGLASRCDEVWLVECRSETQRARLAGRGESGADTERRMRAQGDDLVGRLEAELRIMSAQPGRPRVRRLSTDASLDDTGEAVEDLLAEALLAEVRS